MVRALDAEVQLKVTGKNKFKGDIDKAESKIKSLGKSIQGMGLVSGLGFAAAGVALTSFVTDATRKALEFSQTFRGFTNLIQGDANAFLAELNRVSAGTISDLELVRSANQAILLGIEQEDLPQLLEVSRKLGAAVGRTTAEAFADLTIGIGRQSRLILDNLGLIVRAGEANEKYAASIGKTVGQLTDEQKRIAFTNAAMEQAIQKSDELTDVIDKNVEAISRANKRFEDFKVEIGSDLVTSIGNAVLGVEELNEAIGDLGIKLDIGGKVQRFLDKTRGGLGLTVDTQQTILPEQDRFQSLLSGQDRLQSLLTEHDRFQTLLPVEDRLQTLISQNEQAKEALDKIEANTGETAQSMEEVAKSSGRFINGEQAPVTAEEFEKIKNQRRAEI